VLEIQSSYQGECSLTDQTIKYVTNVFDSVVIKIMNFSCSIANTTSSSVLSYSCLYAMAYSCLFHFMHSI